jgi:hypothetical protein
MAGMGGGSVCVYYVRLGGGWAGGCVELVYTAFSQTNDH